MGFRHVGLGHVALRQDSVFATANLGNMLSLSVDECSVEAEVVVELELEVVVEEDEVEVMESRQGSQAKPFARKSLLNNA